MSAKILLIAMLALVSTTVLAETVSAAYAEVLECPAGTVGAGVYASPPGRGAGICCPVPTPHADYACRRP